MKSCKSIVEEGERFDAHENFDQLVEKLGFKEDGKRNTLPYSES